MLGIKFWIILKIKREKTTAFKIDKSNEMWKWCIGEEEKSKFSQSYYLFKLFMANVKNGIKSTFRHVWECKNGGPQIREIQF